MNRKTAFFDEWTWFKFNDLGLALGMVLKFYNSVAKVLKVSYVCRSYKGKAGKGSFLPPPPSWIGLIINCNINFNKKEALAEMFSCEFFKIFENLLHRAPPEFRVQNTLLRVAINVRFYHVQEILIVQFVLKHTFLDSKWCLWFCAKGP